MDVDRPPPAASPTNDGDGSPLLLLLHETVVGRPSPPAAFLATVRLRRPCAVSTIVLVPAGEAPFEHAVVDTNGSTPRMPAQVDLLFNVRYGPPAVAPPAASRANKLQKVVLDYRPDAVDARGRSGSQSFTLDMPPGVSTNLLIFRSSLPVLTVLIYGRPTGPAIALGPPLPDPDWTTYVRVLEEGASDAAGDKLALSLDIGDPRLPLVCALASLGVDLSEALLPSPNPADGESSCTDTLQGRLQEVLETLHHGGKQLTARLKSAAARLKAASVDEVEPMLVDDGPDAPMPVDDDVDPSPALRLALGHLIELLDFSQRAQLDLALPPNAPELGLLAGLLLLAAATDTVEAAAARELTARVVCALFSHESARTRMVATFSTAAVSPAAARSGATAAAASTVWDLALWALVLETEWATTRLPRTDREAFNSLVYFLSRTTTLPTAPQQPMNSPLTPAALLTYLVASIQVSLAATVVTKAVPSAKALSMQSSTAVEELRLALGALRLWSVDPVSAVLCRAALILPSTLVAICNLTVYPDDDISAAAVALLDIVLADAACAVALPAALSEVPSDVLERLLRSLSPDARTQVEFARLCAYPANILPALRHLAETALCDDLDEDGLFRLQLWLHHIARLRQDDAAIDGTALASTMLEVDRWVARAQRALLADDTSFARDHRAKLNRADALLSLARLSGLVLSQLRPALHAIFARDAGLSERALGSSFVRQAMASAARALGVASYCGSKAFRDAFCPSLLRPALIAAIEEVSLAARILVESTARDDREECELNVFNSTIDGLLDAALADPAIVATSAASLLLSLWPREEDDSARAWSFQQAAMRREDKLRQLSLFLDDGRQTALVAGLKRYGLRHLPSLTTSVARSALEALGGPPSTSATADDPLVVSSLDLLCWLHPSQASTSAANSAIDGRPTSASPQKRPFALSDSPPTTKTYSKQEFRAPRTIAGAGGLIRVGNVSRAPSRHVDDFESSQQPAPIPLPTPPALIFRRDI